MTHNIPPPHPHDHLTHPKYRPDIDGLRAVAILAVVAYHAFPDFIHGGFIGVDIFFVISGFLISTIILGSLERGSFSFLDFYKRRIRRIFPALVLVLASCFAFGWFIMIFPVEYQQLGKHIAGGAGFVSNFMFWHENGYFDNAADTKPLLHLWSLGIEEQFYIFWPLLLWFAWKRRLNLLTITLAIAFISFVLSANKVRSDTVAAFYAPHMRFWELLAGSVLAHMALHKKLLFPNLRHRFDAWLSKMVYAQAPLADGSLLRNFQATLGAVFIVIGIAVITKDKHFPGSWALLPVLGAALIISAGAHAWINRVILSNRVMVWFGLVSFPLYLWHWPLLSFARITEGETPSNAIRVAAVLAAIVLAWLTYWLVEKPVRTGNRSNTKTVALIVLMIIVGYMGYNAFKREGYSFRKNANNIPEQVSSQFEWKYMHNDLCLNKYPYPNDFSHWFCMTNRNENPTLLLVGNSFANQLYPGLANNSSFNGHTILSTGICGAEEPAEPDEADFDNNPLHPCSPSGALKEQKFIANIVEKSGTVKFAIIAGLNREPTPRYILRVKKRIDYLEKNKIKVIVFLPHLVVRHDIRGCYSRFTHLPVPERCIADISERKILDENFKPLIEQITKTNPNVAFFDPNDLFCSKEKCTSLRDGMPLYRDYLGGHMSEYGSMELSKIFEKWAQMNVPQLLNSAPALRSSPPKY